MKKVSEIFVYILYIIMAVYIAYISYINYNNDYQQSNNIYIKTP